MRKIPKSSRSDSDCQAYLPSKEFSGCFDCLNIDNSYEGILARRSGLTKDQVIATLDVVEFIAWQAGYEPSEYAPYIPEVEEETYIVIEDTEDSTKKDKEILRHRNRATVCGPFCWLIKRIAIDRISARDYSCERIG